MSNIIKIWCDGGCSGNQFKTNYGGWGAVMICLNDSGEEILRKELFGGDVNTTNNIMELTAPTEALKRITRTDIPVEVYVDSNYVYQGMTEWINGWKARDWRKSNKKPVENVDFWVDLDNQVKRFDRVTFFKVTAHIGITLNELADTLANKGIAEARGSVNNAYN